MKIYRRLAIKPALIILCILLTFGGFSLWLLSQSSAATSGKTVLYLHAERSDYNQSYNALSLTPAESNTDSTTATASTTALPAGALCNSNGNTSDSYNSITADATSTGNKCVASFISMPVGQTISLATTDTNSFSANNFWFDVQNNKVSAAACMAAYRLSGGVLTQIGSACASPTSSTTLSAFTIRTTPSSNISLAASDRIAIIVYANIATAHTTASGNTASFAFDSSSRVATNVTINYTLSSPGKPTLSGSLDDDFTYAVGTTSCSTSGTTFNVKWTCLQYGGTSTGALNDEDTLAAGTGDSSGWLWLKNSTGNSGASDFGASPTNTFLYQSLPTAYGDGNIRTAVNATNTYTANGSNGSSPYDHAGLVLWTSNTDFIEIQVYSSSSTTGANSAFVVLNNSGVLTGMPVTLNATTTSGVSNRYWLGFQNSTGSYQAQYSTDGVTWTNFGSPVNHGLFARAGLNSYASIIQPSGYTSYAAAFDWFSYGFAAPVYNQISYRWFANADSATPGAPLTTQNTPFVLTSPGEQFRLRLLLNETGQTALSGQNFKLQYAPMASYTTCAAIPSAKYNDISPVGSGTSKTMYAGAGSGAGWTNPNNITALDGANATTTVPSGGASPLLDGYQFGFAIPSDATVNGISINISANAIGGITVDDTVMLLKNGVATGADKFSNTTMGGTYGSSTDLWGTTWTPADINSANFGIEYASYTTQVVSTEIDIDAMTITVYYTSPGISFYNNPTPANAANITTTASDPTDMSYTIEPETYQESNNFTNVQNAFGNFLDAEWDFSLVDNGSRSASTYCLRVVKSDDTPLSTYTNYPMITTTPTIDNFMRGGMWFTRDGAKQGQYWAQ